MSKNYDNWERLVAAVIKREEDRRLCNQLSIRTISMCSEASSMSGFGSSSNYFDVSDDVMFEIENINQESDQKPVPKLNPLEEGVLEIRQQLGKGRFGTSILTQLQRGVQVSDQEFLAKGTQLVMKKLRSKVLKGTEDEFKTVFGNCRHENVSAPRAYYFSSKGNFLFYDYYSRGSVYDLLQGKSEGRPNWDSRVKIARGAARGIAHIHGQYGGKLALGNVKSSNIFLNSEQYGCVSDFGLVGIMIRPERWFDVRQYKNPSQENDVCSFGVVLLELLTGKSPKELQAGLGGDIVKWAHSITHEDWITKLFDQSLWSSELPYQRLLPLCDELDMLRFEEQLELHSKTGVEMLEMLQVAMKCLDKLRQDRPKMFQVVSKLENMCEPVPPRSLIIPTLNCCQLTHY